MKCSICVLAILVSGITSGGESKDKPQPKIAPLPLAQVEARGELFTRIAKNYARLEETRYQPGFVFLTDKESNDWPGDTEGRTLLGLVMAAQTSHREPLYLDEILSQLQEHLNSKGYMGKIYPSGIMDEQQLAGNGWVMRALCEYYEWKKDPKALDIVKSISDNLFVPGKGYYQNYPIQPGSRKMDGGMIGAINEVRDGWRITGDIGCVFIGMTGAIHAYQYTHAEKLKEVIDEMVNKFLQVDMYGLKIQVHAGMTALLGLIRYAEMTGNEQLMAEVIKRWDLYVKYGMTENYEIYNWFGIYKAWTESCGLIDSYMVATALWKHTQDPQYLSYLDLIYYNAICHVQRANGGFGCDNNPGSSNDFVNVYANEAWWCCTMRGGEGLSRVAENSYFTQGDTLYVVHYGDNKATANFGEASIIIQQASQYPMAGRVRLTVKKAVNAKHVVIKLNAMQDWSENPRVTINNESVPLEIQKGFIVLKHAWKEGDVIDFGFDEKVRMESVINKENCSVRQRKLFYGPLLLGYSGKESIAIDDVSTIRKTPDKTVHLESVNTTMQSPVVFGLEGADFKLSPLYHLMSPEVEKGAYKKQFLFESHAKAQAKQADR
jgi:hypothetical protein